MNLEEILEQIGLSKREASIYLQLLRAGPLSPTDIADKTGIKRPNIYDSLKGLETKGLIHYQFKNKRRLMVASSPQNLLDINKQKFDLTKKIVPTLLSLDREQNFESTITFYQGRKGMREMMSAYPKAKKKEAWFLVSPQDTNKMLGKDFIESLIKERIKKGIKIRSIRPAEKESFWESQEDALGKQMTEAAYVSPEYTFSLSMGIFDNKTIFFSSKREGFGFMVESKELTEVMRMFYDNLWEHSGKISSP